MCVNLLWSPFSIFLISGIWHKLSPVISAGVRRGSSSKAPLLQRKDNFGYVGRLQAPPPRRWTHYTTSLSLPQYFTGFIAHIRLWFGPNVSEMRTYRSKQYLTSYREKETRLLAGGWAKPFMSCAHENLL